MNEDLAVVADRIEEFLIDPKVWIKARPQFAIVCASAPHHTRAISALSLHVNFM